MKTTLYDTLHIGLHADKKGLMMNLVGIEKSVNETKFLTHFGSYQNRDDPNPNLPKSSLQLIKNKTKEKRFKENLICN